MSERREYPEKFLVDSDVDPHLVFLLRRLGFRAKSVLDIRCENDDVKLLAWANRNGYILVCHDKHREARVSYSFFSEAHYRNGRILRISGNPGQDAMFALGKILVHRPQWQKHFAEDSGEVVVSHAPDRCRFTSAAIKMKRARHAALREMGAPVLSSPRPARKPRRSRPAIEQLDLDLRHEE